ncbi:MAG: endonuclease/exonuclease/phosphatase family protein [Spirochaetia bacterium]|nr:endonuclease/exonuclease/phosphatase family protein [Spirochaetia bacterium]
MKKLLKIISLSILAIIIVLAAFIRITTFHPDDIEDIKVFCNENVKPIDENKKLKILSWNIQFLAGKNYIFFFDVENNEGPDEKPSKKDIELTLNETVRIIIDEKPDIILLQEVDDAADRTYKEDQLQKILEKLPKEYGCHASAFYWKAFFIPHPRIMGSAGMKLSTISKYKINEAVRYQLPKMPADIVSSNFQLKRAILETTFEISNSKKLVVYNTHLDAFAQESDTMEKQVQMTKNLLLKTKNPWLIGGDFNLLPSKKSYERLQKSQKYLYKTETELKPFFEYFNSFPSLKQIESDEYEKYYTHWPNDEDVKKPDRTIDYIFYSKNIKPINHYVRQKDTLKISDHLPLLMEFIFD